MRLPRVIPILLYRNKGLVKTFKFKDEKYVGDPINAIKILNEKEVDELVFLDIDASKNKSEPDYKMIEDIASECFMPLCYGGGISSIHHAEKIFSLGVEKIVLNSSLYSDDNLLEELVNRFGSQSIVVSVDVRKSIFKKYTIYSHGGNVKQSNQLLDFTQNLEKRGAGEILLNAIDQDGLQKGYDLNLIEMISNHLAIPVVACGGAGSLNDFKAAVERGASAVAAGSLFVFWGKHRAVLINYPERHELEKIFKS